MKNDLEIWIDEHVSYGGNITGEDCKTLLKMINEVENPELILSFIIHVVYFKGLLD